MKNTIKNLLALILIYTAVDYGRVPKVEEFSDTWWVTFILVTIGYVLLITNFKNKD